MPDTSPDSTDKGNPNQDPFKFRADSPKSNRLRMPGGIGPRGLVKDITEAYLQSMIEIPEVLYAVLDELTVIRLYFEKKGISENLFTEEEVEQTLSGEEEKDDAGDFQGR